MMVPRERDLLSPAEWRALLTPDYDVEATDIEPGTVVPLVVKEDSDA